MPFDQRPHRGTGPLTADIARVRDNSVGRGRGGAAAERHHRIAIGCLVAGSVVLFFAIAKVRFKATSSRLASRKLAPGARPHGTWYFSRKRRQTPHRPPVLTTLDCRSQKWKRGHNRRGVYSVVRLWDAVPRRECPPTADGWTTETPAPTSASMGGWSASSCPSLRRADCQCRTIRGAGSAAE